jgi:hypothetical protein
LQLIISRKTSSSECESVPSLLEKV